MKLARPALAMATPGWLSFVQRPISVCLHYFFDMSRIIIISLRWEVESKIEIVVFKFESHFVFKLSAMGFDELFTSHLSIKGSV